MADKYPNFAALEQHERSGIDYCIVIRREEPAFAIVAPHGGGIEPGTSEIADAIACQRWSFYNFEGLKRSGNSGSHCVGTPSREVSARTFPDALAAERRMPAGVASSASSRF